MFSEATFDENIGREIFLIVQDQPDYAHALTLLRSLTLRAAPGFVDTNHGTVAFIIWTIAVGTPSEQQIEQFLNPYLQQTMDYVSSLSEQSHVKVFILESVCNRVCNWFEFENVFSLDAFALTMSIIRDSAGAKNFDYLAAIQDVVDNHTTSDLLKLSPNGNGDLPATLTGDTLGISMGQD